MSVAAQTAVALDRELRAGRGLRRLTSSFQRRVAAHGAGAWLLATGEDLRYPTTEGSRVRITTLLTHRYLDRVMRAATADPGVNVPFLEVLGLRRQPASLFRPLVAAAALRRQEPPDCEPASGGPVGYPTNSLPTDRKVRPTSISRLRCSRSTLSSVALSQSRRTVKTDARDGLL